VKNPVILTCRVEAFKSSEALAKDGSEDGLKSPAKGGI